MGSIYIRRPDCSRTASKYLQQALSAAYGRDPSSYLYQLFRNCRSTAGFLRDQLRYISHTLDRCSPLPDDHFDLRIHCLGRQITFLQILTNKVEEDLNDYHCVLKETAENRPVSNKRALVEEGQRISAELDDLRDIIAFTKKSVHILFRHSSKRPFGASNCPDYD
ncbi:MAG: hypothetical protein ACO1NU_15075 [Arcticibacter sp.]